MEWIQLIYFYLNLYLPLIFLLLIVLVLKRELLALINRHIALNNHYTSLTQILLELCDYIWFWYGNRIKICVIIMYVIYVLLRISSIFGEQCDCLLTNIVELMEYLGVNIEENKLIIGQMLGAEHGLYMMYKTPWDIGLDINNINHTNNMGIKENTLCIIEKIEKGRKMVIGSVPMCRAQAHVSLNLDIIKLLKGVPMKNLDFIKNPNFGECEQQLDLNIRLHEFKKFYPQYRHKELIFIENPRGDHKGIADGLFFDKHNNTISPIQHKFSLGNRFDKFEGNSLSIKYNQTTHLMNITLVHANNVDDIIPILKKQNCEFDIEINIYNPTFDASCLQEIDILNNQFMQEQGEQISEDFVRDFDNKDFSKFHYDRKFIYAFHEFTKNYLGENGYAKWLSGTKSEE